MKQVYDIKMIQPIKINDLIRVGKNGDGGYILSKRHLEQTETLLSFGISNEWSFEKHFIELSGQETKLYALDASVSLNSFRIKSILYFFLMIFRFLSGSISRAKKSMSLWIDYSKNVRNFNKFFSTKSHKYFIPMFLGQKDNNIYMSVEKLFKDHVGETKDLSIFVKMDIENWEYRTLPQFKSFFDKINGFAIEFHELDITSSIFVEMLKTLSSDFYIAHIHANNYGGVIHETNLPLVLEITFINKKIVTDTTLSSETYPIAGLDFPNNKEECEIPIVFNSTL